LSDNAKAVLIQVGIILASGITVLIVGNYFSSRGMYTIGSMGMWIMTVPLGIYIIFGKHVYFQGLKMTRQRRLTVGIIGVLFAPTIWFFGTLNDGRLGNIRREMLPRDPALELLLPSDAVDHFQINAMFRAYRRWGDPIRQGEVPGNTARDLITNRLNIVIYDPETPDDVLHAAIKMRDFLLDAD
jgi:phage terminase large subunit-like protein